MRRHLKISLAIVVGLSWIGSARPGDSDQAREIVARGIKAAGGEEILKKRNAITMKEKGKYYGMGDGLPYTANYAMQWPLQFRMEVEGVFIVVLDRDKGWMHMNGETKEMTKEQVAQSIKDHRAGWIASLLPLKDKAFALTALGESQVENQPALGVKVTRKDYPEVKLFFDKKSGLLVKCEFRTLSQEQGKEVNQEVFYQDYRVVDDMQFPRKMVIKRDGKIFVEGENYEVRATEKIDGKIFSRP